VPLRPELQPIVDALAGPGRSEVTLDELAAAIDTRAVSTADIDALMEALEERGVAVRAPGPVDLPAELARVIGAAKGLSAELGRRPTSDEIAARAGLDRAAVRRALLYARVLSR
jgi:hypothetical protein